MMRMFADRVITPVLPPPLMGEGRGGGEDAGDYLGCDWRRPHPHPRPLSHRGRGEIAIALRPFRDIIAIVLLVCPTAAAGDWPQILGPTRNGVAVDERIRRQWGKDVPKTLWQREVGQGYAGVAVAGERVILFHRVGDREVVEALHASTGEPLWKHSWAVRYYGRIDPDTGPRCVPLVAGDAVYLHGVAGRLECVALEDGRQRWSRETGRAFPFSESYFGVGSSPIVMGDKLLVNVGGRKQAGIVAFSIEDGRTLWQSTDQAASYSSPVAATIDGQPLALFVTRLQFVGLNPDDGQVHFSLRFGAPGPTVNAANPLLIGDRHVFLTASYRIGAQLIRLQKAGASARSEVVWSSNDAMSSQYSTSVVHDGALYGIDGRADAGSPRLRCLDPMTGRAYWSQQDFGMATLILAGDTLLIMKTDGELVLAEASTAAYRELARLRLFDSTIRALPALSSGKLYLRDGRILKCVDLSAG